MDMTKNKLVSFSKLRSSALEISLVFLVISLIMSLLMNNLREYLNDKYEILILVALIFHDRNNSHLVTIFFSLCK